jgi:PleD family two-component response regulator
VPLREFNQSVEFKFIIRGTSTKPVHSQNSAHATSAAGSFDMADGKPISILLVDDEDEFRDTCAMWMSRHGHDVAEAADGHEALHACTRKNFDVVVLDLNMPGLSAGT